MKQALCGWLLCGAVASVAAQTTKPAPGAQSPTTLVVPPGPLLPTTDRLVQDDAAAAVPAESTEVASVLKECGLKRTETRAVMTPTTSTPIPAGWVRAYQFVDATGAYSAYSYFRAGGRPRRSADGPTETDLPNGERVVLTGVSLLRVQTKLYPEAADALLTTTETSLPKVGGSKGQPPLLPKLMPKTGLEADTLRYALGPVEYAAMGGVLPPDLLGWNKDVEIATAHYAERKGSGTLTLLMYPTPQIAGDRGRAIEELVKQRGPATYGTVRMRRLGPLVAVTSGSFSPQQAEDLVAAVRLNEEVVYNQSMPTEFHTEIRKTVSLLESIFVFTGVGIVAAVMLALFLGGGRAWLRVRQGKPAWVDPEFLHIDLSGRPEPLKPSHGDGDAAAPR